MAGETEPQIRRVLMTGDTVGGVWTFTLELAAGLAARGVETLLATFGALPSAAQKAEARAVPGLCFLASAFRLEWMEDPWEDVAVAGRWLLDLEREYSPDVIHLNSFGHGALPWSVPVVLMAHSCVLSWWTAVRGTAIPAEWNTYRAEVARSLAAVDLITAPSAAMAAALGRHYGSASSSCKVIPNGRAAAKFHKREKRPFILTAGRLWDEAKNVAILAQVAPELPWPLYVAGEARGWNGARELKLSGCRMLGALPAVELAEWQARAAIYAAPARYEPFGLCALEAALSGCALVLGDIESQREIWGEAALFVSPDDAHGLREALRNLIANPGLRQTMARRAYERALTFDAAHMAQAWLDTYEEMRVARKKQCVS